MTYDQYRESLHNLTTLHGFTDMEAAGFLASVSRADGLKEKLAAEEKYREDIQRAVSARRAAN